MSAFPNSSTRTPRRAPTCPTTAERRRRARSGAATAALILTLWGGASGAAWAQEAAPSTSDPASAITKGSAPVSTTVPGAPDAEGCFGDIVQRPGCGTEPGRPNERGGWQQAAVFGGILAGLGGIGALAWRSAQRGRAGRATPADPSS